MRLCHLIYKKCTKRLSRALLIKIISKLEKGEMHSLTLRDIMKDFHNVEVGKFSYGCFNPMNIRPGVKIGRYCSFGRNVMVFDANHPIEFTSTHPFFYEPSFGYVDEFHAVQVSKVIENDVWIGHNALIMPNVKRIGNGAIIGAGAVVTKDVPDYAIVAGNPAKLIRYRFSPETIEKLLEEKWWEKDIEEIKPDIDKYTANLQ